MSDEEGKEVIIEYNKIKAERDRLIDDLTWYKAKVERLERELATALNGELSTYDELQKYVLELQSDVTEYQKENEQLNKVADEAIDLAESENRKVLKLEHENKRLTRLTHKLTTHRTMWDELKQWRRDMLEIDKNDTQLIGLGLVMDELEHNWLYREEK